MKKIRAEIIDGKFRLHNQYPDLAGIQIIYSGQVYINPTLPEGWALRAGKNKILIVNFGTNIIQNGSDLFTYEGVLNVRNCYGSTKQMEKVRITVANKKVVWGNSSMRGMTEKNDTWDSLEHNNISKPKQPKIFGRKYKGQYQKSNVGIVNVPMQKNLHTKGGEYTLNGKDYKGYYHIHTDIGYAMTGKTHSKASKHLQRGSDKIIKKPQKMATQSTPRTTRTSSTPSTGGGY